jgi:hypothetical protein
LDGFYVVKTHQPFFKKRQVSLFIQIIIKNDTNRRGPVSGRSDFGKRHDLHRPLAHQFDKHTDIMAKILWFETENKWRAWFEMVGKRANAINLAI